ncbi:hypothetical protein ACLE20_03165 [Rhizobium sp. YIM 134829]|uniref:hypothetical protein n=1 Tax=Rhizobium sp. YIM 134829 TaxID=3390453 RepID=UPI00397D0016
MSQTVHILLVDDDPAEQILLARQLRKVQNFDLALTYCETVDAALALIASGEPVSMVLIDNRLQHEVDFRKTVPLIRQAGFIGPIGVISSSLADPYFQAFEDYGVDFRLDKAELDPTSIEFLLREYLAAS